jgi:uncharacterized integral membrane protein
MQFLWVVMLFFALIVAVFAVQNAAAVPLHVLFWNFHASLALIMIGSAFVGALFSSLLSLFRKRRMSESDSKTKSKETKLDNKTMNGGDSGGTANMAS